MSRLAVDTTLAVRVIVRSEVGVQFGVVRSLSDQGAVLELSVPPPLGTGISVAFQGLLDSKAAPEAYELEGTVRHAMLWRVGPDHPRHRWVAVRWGTPAPRQEAASIH